MALRYRAPLPADAGGPFVNGAEKANDRPTFGRPIAGASLMAPRYRAPLPADAGGPFVNGAEKANGRPTLGRPLVFSMRSLH